MRPNTPVLGAFSADILCRQDYLYLKYYARAYGCDDKGFEASLSNKLTLRIHCSLLIAKSSTYGSIQASTQTILNIINEVSTHKSFCAKWGITEAELAATPESPSTTAYGAYLLDIGLQGLSPPPA